MTGMLATALFLGALALPIGPNHLHVDLGGKSSITIHNRARSYSVSDAKVVLVTPSSKGSDTYFSVTAKHAGTTRLLVVCYDGTTVVWEIDVS